ncbi:MAG: polysaccharide pyruvyl transferase family protein [Planctomycetota bacterium]|nr:polysaccharide pyruvyl transferase family protein [Planctomycetota bacterium]
MKAVIAGPFGHGTLADEAVLAGLLRHLAAGKHEATVLSADLDRTQTLHGIAAVEAGPPESFLSNRELWKALGKAHLLILASGGMVSGRGRAPARRWLALLEHAQIAGLKTAVVGIGAETIAEPKERARVQRLLHHCVDGLSTRDFRSKEALMSYGLGANRISANGDPSLALAGNGAGAAGAAAGTRVGVVLAEGLPSRGEFGVEPHAPAEEFAAATEVFLKGLLGAPALSATLFHDDTEPAREFAGKLCAALPPERVTTQAADRPLAEIQARMAECGVIASFSLHGLVLGAGAGVPVIGFGAEPGAAEFLTALGLGDSVVPASPSAFDSGKAAEAVVKLLSRSTVAREMLKPRMAVLRKREAQNARMLDLLVPRRVVYARQKELSDTDPAEEEASSPPRRRRGPPKRRSSR